MASSGFMCLAVLQKNREQKYQKPNKWQIDYFLTSFDKR